MNKYMPVMPIVRSTAQTRQQPEMASVYHKQLEEYIRQFEKTLDQEHEVAMRLVSFGQTVQFSVQRIGYYNPKLISFYGEMPDGSAVQLIQNVSQISFLLMAVKRKDPEKPKCLIGFCSDEEELQAAAQPQEQSAATSE